jgi:hypothetical protein
VHFSPPDSSGGCSLLSHRRTFRVAWRPPVHAVSQRGVAGREPCTSEARRAERQESPQDIRDGANPFPGLGLETVRVLAAARAQVIDPARNVARGEKAIAGLAHVEVRFMDLSDPESIDKFRQVLRRFPRERRPLHLLIHSAGIMAGPPPRRHEGRTFGAPC